MGHPSTLECWFVVVANVHAVRLNVVVEGKGMTMLRSERIEGARGDRVPVARYTQRSCAGRKIYLLSESCNCPVLANTYLLVAIHRDTGNVPRNEYGCRRLLNCCVLNTASVLGSPTFTPDPERGEPRPARRASRRRREKENGVQ